MLTFIPRVVFGAIVAAAAAQIPAQAAQGPTPAAVERQTRDGVAFVTGGVGLDEREQLKQMEREFNLKLLFAQSDGALVSDVAVVVKNAAGKPLLTAQAGPVFLVQLPPGTYTVEAASEGKTQSRRVTVGKGLSAAQFMWPGSSAAPQ